MFEERDGEVITVGFRVLPPKAAAFVALTVAAVFVPAVSAAAAPYTFADPIGDNNGAVDIGAVTVEWDAGGPLSLAVTLANVDIAFDPGQWVEIQLDTNVDGSNDFLIHTGEPFPDPRLCERTGPSDFFCSTNPDVAVELEGGVLTVTLDSGLVGFGDDLRFAIAGLAGFPSVVGVDFAGPWIVPPSADVTPPVIEVAIDPIVVWATTPEGNDVLNLYTVIRAVDDIDPDPLLVCSPADFFPIGETLVICGASDVAGNWAFRTITVVVLGPGDILETIADRIREIDVGGSQGIAAGFDAAAKLIGRDKTGPACRMLAGLSHAVTGLAGSGTGFPDWPVDTIAYVGDQLLECETN